MKLSRLVLLALLLNLVCPSAVDADIGTAFSLQGRLADADGLAAGPVDLRITPWDAATAGATLEAPVELAGVALEQGVFSVDVDFGPLPFLGEPVWLAIEVRGPGEADYTLLEPRQRMAPTPYALHARSVAVDSIDGFAIQDGAVGASAIDPTQVQRRIGPDCAAGEALAGVGEDGTSSCVPTGEGDWYLWSDGSAVTARKKVSIGTDGTRGAQLLVTRNSGISTPHVELVETENDYARLSFANGGDGHFGFWTLAARTYPTDDGGSAADRINFFNNRTGDAMVLMGDGRLGIGVFTPSAELDVDGDARIRGLGPGSGPARPVLVQADGRLVSPPAPTRYLSLNPSDFVARDNAVAITRIAGFIYVSDPDDTAYLSASVHLPDGATVEELALWLVDSSSTEDVSVSLWQMPLGTNTAIPLASFNSSGSTPDMRNPLLPVGDHVVDNSANSYLIFVSATGWPGSNIGIYNARIRYRPAAD